MASRSLGVLTLDLVAKIGGYEAGLDKAEKEAKKRAAAIEKAFDNAFIAIGAGFAALGSAGAAALAVVNQQAEAIANYQDLAEKIGDTASAMASLQTAATVSGTSLDTVAAASVKLTASLSKGGEGAENVQEAIENLGLSFEDFTKLSPVDQIDAVSKALNGFEDGANKTATAVALFGKSGAELIPFLNDLAEGSERNVRLTEEQIKAADDYTKQVAHLKDEFDKFIQQQSADLIPTLSQVVKLLADIAKNEELVSSITAAVNVAVGAFVTVLQTLLVVGSDVIYVLKQTGNEIGGIAAQIGALLRLDVSGFRAISTAMKEDAARARAELDKFQAQVMKIGQPAYVDDEIRRLQARSASNVPARPALPSLRTGGGGGGARRSGGAAKDPFAEAQRYLESLQKQLDKTKDLSVVEQALLEIQSGRLGKVTEAQKQSILGVAAQIDSAKALEEQEKANNKALEERLRLEKQLQDEGARFTEQFLTPQEEYAKNIENVNRLLDAGVISLETATRAVAKYREELKGSKEGVEEFDEFTKNAIKGTQDAMAGFFEGLIDGSNKSFKDVANNFATMLAKMAAQALAADLTKKLFGATGGAGGEGTGWLGQLFSAFGGARALGGPVMPNSLYRVNENGPELFQAANGNQYLMTGTDSGKVIPNGAGFSQQNTFVIAGNIDRETQNQIAAKTRQQSNTAVRRFG